MADSKITELTSLVSPSSDDLLIIVDDPNGSPTNKKIVVEDVIKLKGATFVTTGSITISDGVNVNLPAHSMVINECISWTGSNPSAFFIPKTAWYNISFSVQWSASSDAPRFLFVYITGSATNEVVQLGSIQAGQSVVWGQNLEVITYLISGTQVHLVGRRESGGSLLLSGRYTFLTY